MEKAYLTFVTLSRELQGSCSMSDTDCEGAGTQNIFVCNQNIPDIPKMLLWIQLVGLGRM